MPRKKTPKPRSSFIRWVAPSLEILLTEETVKWLCNLLARLANRGFKSLARGFEACVIFLRLSARAFGKFMGLALALFGAGVLFVEFVKKEHSFFFVQEEVLDSFGDGVSCSQIAQDYLLQCGPSDLGIWPEGQGLKP